jgi:outer membrane protein assembly factor BamD (BamD/ComL family)
MSTRKRSIDRVRAGLLAVSLLLGAACTLGVNERHWQQAETFVQQGQYLRAIEEYSKIVNFEQRSLMAIRAQTEIANIYEVHLKDYLTAIRAYRDAFRRSDDPAQKMRARWAVARIYSDRLGNFQASCEEYETLYKEYGKGSPEGPEILLLLAKSLMDAGRFADSAMRFSEFRILYPGHVDGPRTTLLEAQAYMNSDQLDRAIELFREIITRLGSIAGYESLVAESYYGLGLALEQKDELTQALEAYRASLATYPNPRVIEVKIDRLEKRKKERRL